MLTECSYTEGAMVALDTVDTDLVHTELTEQDQANAALQNEVALLKRRLGVKSKRVILPRACLTNTHRKLT